MSRSATAATIAPFRVHVPQSISSGVPNAGEALADPIHARLPHTANFSVSVVVRTSTPSLARRCNVARSRAFAASRLALDEQLRMQASLAEIVQCAADRVRAPKRFRLERDAIAGRRPLQHASLQLQRGTLVQRKSRPVRGHSPCRCISDRRRVARIVVAYDHVIASPVPIVEKQRAVDCQGLGMQRGVAGRRIVEMHHRPAPAQFDCQPMVIGSERTVGISVGCALQAYCNPRAAPGGVLQRVQQRPRLQGIGDHRDIATLFNRREGSRTRT